MCAVICGVYTAVTVALDELCTSWQQCGNVTEVCYKQDACEYGICDCGPGYERYTQGIIDYCTLSKLLYSN